MLRLIRWFASFLPQTHACALCGKPAVGIACEIVGKLPWKVEGQETPGTKLYLSKPTWCCKEHLN